MGKKEIKKILVTGAVGQIGSELTLELRRMYGGDNVVACGRKTKPSPELADSGPFEWADVTEPVKLKEVSKKHRVDTIINMAAILSAVGEEKPNLAWHVNVTGLVNTLELARELDLTQVVCPSSMAVFGAGCPRENTPQDTILKPSTMYGVTKVTGRYPGIISAETLPGGGTTDYAVEIYYKAIEQKKYTCFVREDTRLPMMYMPDCIKATIDLMQADFDKLEHHGDFNVGSMSFTAGELAAEIRKHIPDFEVTYEPDFRQKIADSWPLSLDDSAARKEWGWSPGYDLDAMTTDMLDKLRKRHAEGKLYR
jgi:nucleoside-diphosphate-sugar epimerase